MLYPLSYGRAFWLCDGSGPLKDSILYKSLRSRSTRAGEKTTGIQEPPFMRPEFHPTLTLILSRQGRGNEETGEETGICLMRKQKKNAINFRHDSDNGGE